MHKTRIGKKIFALLLAQAVTVNMILGGSFTGTTVYAAEKNRSESSTQVDKDEVVYIITDSEGEVDHIIVSDKLSNQDNLEELLDKTDLTDIENVKGEEEYEKNGEDHVTWKADGNEISYQGKSDKALPVQVKMSYTLDGKSISAKDLVGKSGKVTIRFDYTNHEKRKVSVDGKEYEVYVPFTMMSGMMLDSDRFSNVTVKNGKAITEGDKTIVVGYAVPGLKDSLAISEDIMDEGNIEFPEYVEVTADVRDFSMGMTMTAVTNDLLNDLDDFEEKDGDGKNSIDDLEEATNDLVDGTEQLHDGTSDAYDGAKKIADNMKKISTGAGSLKTAIGLYTDGVGALYQKAPELKQGVSALETGASRLSKGAASLQTGTEGYVDGVNTLAAGLLGDGTQENPGYINGVEQLAKGASALSGLSGLDQVSSAIQLMEKATSTEKTYTGADGVESSTLGYGAAALKSGLDQIVQGAEDLKKGTQAESLKQLAGGLATANTLMESTTKKVTLAEGKITEAEKMMKDASDEVKEQVENVNTAKKQLQEEKDSLDGEIENCNDKIHTKNADIKEAQEKANDTINSSIDGTVAQLQSAKDALKKAETDDVKFTKEISAIDEEIEALKNKKNPVEVTQNAVSNLEKTKTSLDTSEISTKALDSSAENMKKITFTDVNLTQEKGGVTQIAKSLSEAANQLGTDPVDDLLSSLKSAQTGAASLNAGVNSLHTNLVSLENATKDLPAAAQGITALNQGFATLTGNNNTIRKGINALVENGATLIAGAKEVATGASKLSEGTNTLGEGTDALKQGVGKLASNNTALNDGAKSLAEGSVLLKDGSFELEDGMRELLNGSEDLMEGMKEYKEEGIQKLLDLYNDDIAGLGDRFKAIQQAGREYQTYTQLADGQKGSVKFIYKSDGTEKE